MKRMRWVVWMLVCCGLGFIGPKSAFAQSVSLDANLALGYQGLDGLVDVQSGQRIGLEVYGNEIEGVNGFSVVLTYVSGYEANE